MAKKKKAAPKKKAPKEASAKKASAKKAVTKKAAKKAPAKKASSKKEPPKKAAPKKTEAKKAGATTSKKAGATASKKAAPHKAAPKKAAGKKAAEKPAKKARGKAAEAEAAAEDEGEVVSTPPGGVRAGMRAPNFVLPSDEGKEVSLSSFKGKKVVLYFYPRDDTPGCATQGGSYSDLHDEFQKRVAVIVRVSKDSVKRHQNFKKKYELPFALLADEQGEVISAYGSWG